MADYADFVGHSDQTIPSSTAYSKEDALAYLEVTRRMFEGKVGFAHFTEKIAALEAYVRENADENEALHSFLEQEGLEDSFQEFKASQK